MDNHRVNIRLRYTEFGTPWKWQGACLCGWRCLSWYWQDGPRGALPMSLEHLRSQENSMDKKPRACKCGHPPECHNLPVRVADCGMCCCWQYEHDPGTA